MIFNSELYSIYWVSIIISHFFLFYLILALLDRIDADRVTPDMINFLTSTKYVYLLIWKTIVDQKCKVYATGYINALIQHDTMFF